MRLCCLLFLLLALLSNLSSAKVERFVVVDAEGNAKALHVEGSTSRDIDGDSNWTVEVKKLKGGKQEGVQLVTIDNGKMQITLIPQRGLGIHQVKMGDVFLGWDSPVKEVVHPRFMDLGSRGGLGWLEGFNEYMCRCGLEYAGGPGEDKFINNQGNESTMDLTLHGKIANIPASYTEVIVDTEKQTMRVVGKVYEKMFFGPNLELQTELSTKFGSNSFEINDKVINHSAAKQEFILIYHANHGRPLLEEGSQLVAPVKRVFPINDHAAKAIDTYTKFRGPVDGFVEEVFCIHPYADGEGNTEVMLKNAAGDKAVSLKYPVKQLPHLTLWKNTLSESNGYVTGVEPGTSFPNNRSAERKAGRLAVLEAGEERPFHVEFALHDSKSAVSKTANRIESIQGGRNTQVDREPEKLPAE